MSGIDAAACAVRSASRVLSSALGPVDGVLLQLRNQGLLPLGWAHRPGELLLLAAAPERLAVASPLLQVRLNELLSGMRRIDSRMLERIAGELCEIPVALPLPPIELQDLALALDARLQHWGVTFCPHLPLLALRWHGPPGRSPLQRLAEVSAFRQALQRSARLLPALESARPVLQARADGLLVRLDTTAPGAGVALFQLLLLALSDLALLGRLRESAPPLPSCAFHFGDCFLDTWSEPGLPALGVFAGALPVALEGMLAAAASGELLLGDFTTRVPTSARESAFLIEVDSAGFVQRAARDLASPRDLRLHGLAVRALHGFVAGDGRRHAATGALSLGLNLHVEGQPTLILGRR